MRTNATLDLIMLIMHTSRSGHHRKEVVTDAHSFTDSQPLLASQLSILGDGLTEPRVARHQGRGCLSTLR